MHDILVCSSNIGTVKIAQNHLGEEGTYNALQAFWIRRNGQASIFREKLTGVLRTPDRVVHALYRLRSLWPGDVGHGDSNYAGLRRAGQWRISREAPFGDGISQQSG